MLNFKAKRSQLLDPNLLALLAVGHLLLGQLVDFLGSCLSVGIWNIVIFVEILEPISSAQKTRHPCI